MSVYSVWPDGESQEGAQGSSKIKIAGGMELVWKPMQLSKQQVLKKILLMLYFTIREQYKTRSLDLQTLKTNTDRNLWNQEKAKDRHGKRK